MKGEEWATNYKPSVESSPYMALESVTAGKSAFDHVLALIQRHMTIPTFTHLDVGCGTGGFLYQAQELFPEAILTGVDLTPEFVTFAQGSGLFRESTSFEVADILTWTPARTWDVVTCLGTAAVFPDLPGLLQSLGRLVNPVHGLLVVQAFLLDIDADVQLRFRHWPETGGQWRSGFNLFSRDRAVRTLQELEFAVDVVPFDLQIDIRKPPKDVLRSYTERVSSSGKLLEISPLGVITNSEFLVGLKSAATP